MSEKKKRFFPDLWDKLYEKIIEYAAWLILAVVVLFLSLFGYYRVRDWYQEKQDRAENYLPRQLTGLVVDAENNDSIPGAWAAIPGEFGDTTRTNEQGIFRLSFRAHKDSLTVTLNLRADGYEGRTIYGQAIPLNQHARRHVNRFVLQSSGSRPNPLYEPPQPAD